MVPNVGHESTNPKLRIFGAGHKRHLLRLTSPPESYCCSCGFLHVLDLRVQGRTQNLMWVGSFQEKVDLFDGAGVQSTPSMRSMLKLGGSGGMPPQENFEK